HLMAVALKDEKLIDAMFNAVGGWKWYFDEYIADGRFYMEEFGKYYSNIGTMLTYCEALERLGLGRYGYGYTGAGGPSTGSGQGATMRKFLEMKMWIGYPRDDSRAGMPRYHAVTMGDAGPSTIIPGYDADGRGGNHWWNSSHMNGPLPKMMEPLWYEIGHRRWPDAGFDYFLAQMRSPGEELHLPSLYFGLGPVDPKKVKPPPAQSYVSRQRGFALLRAEESPAYWESPAPAVAMQFAMYYVHYVHDCFSILGYNAHNRMIYERMGSARRGYAGGEAWRDHVRGHCGVVVDGLKAQPVDNGNEGTKNHRVRHAFAGPVKFVAARARGVYPDIDQERALFLTREYLLDVFRLCSAKSRTYDWQVLSPGLVAAPPPEAWTAVAELPAPKDRSLARPLLSETRVIAPGEKPWTAAIVQSHLPRGVGVRVSMLGEPGTFVLASRPPIGKTEVGTSLLVTRQAPSTTFVSLHDPFAGGPAANPARKLARIEQNDRGVAVAVTGDARSPANDRILLAYGEEVDQPLTLKGGGEGFTFTGHGFIRIGMDDVRAFGNIRRMQVKVVGEPKLFVNGKQVAATVRGGMLLLEGRD
ncbi:MAG: hypothetical protein WBF17_01430, partial [Phycisphaerae bacterium]